MESVCGFTLTLQADLGLFVVFPCAIQINQRFVDSSTDQSG